MTNQIIIELAALSMLEYEQRREPVAKDMGIRVFVLDRMVRAEQRKSEDASGFSLREVEPWPEPVDGDALLDSITQAVRRYLVLPPNGAEVIALWVIAAHAFNGFQISPRLHIRSPEKRCGKTVALDVLECLTPRSIRTENITTAVLFRLVDGYQPTLLILKQRNSLRTKALQRLLPELPPKFITAFLGDLRSFLLDLLR